MPVVDVYNVYPDIYERPPRFYRESLKNLGLFADFFHLYVLLIVFILTWTSFVFDFYIIDFFSFRFHQENYPLALCVLMYQFSLKKCDEVEIEGAFIR